MPRPQTPRPQTLPRHVTRPAPRLLLLAALLAAAACGGDDPVSSGPPVDDDPAGLRLVEVAGGFEQPVFLTSPAGDDRLFVVDQPGRVWIVRDGAVVDRPFLDIRGRVSFGGERGLLGLAFHPDFDANGLFYVSFTDAEGDTRIESFTVSADPDVAEADPTELILALAQPFSNHNGGLIAFGPDGMFYIGLGDGGSAGDPLGNGQDPSTLLGTLLRVDVDGGSPYAIPPDNPFADGIGGREEIWAFGLRNPWRWAFDDQLDVLVIADVGQNRLEEVNVQPAGAAGINYGWNVLEGTDCFDADECDRTGLTEPDFEYTHAEGCSITGGYVYRGSLAPSLSGQYLFSDFCSGFFRALELDGDDVVGEETLDLTRVGSVTSFGLDAAGELYVLTLEGAVFRFEEGG